MDKSRCDNLSTNRGSARPNNVQPNLNVNSAPNPSTASSPSQMPKFGATLNSNSTSASSTPSSPNPASSSSVLSRTQTQPQNLTTRNDVTFKSDRIGQWSAKQDNPFAEQNRKAAEKKAAQEEARKKALPYIKLGGIIGGCLVLIAIIILIIITATRDPDVDYTPEIAGSSTEDIVNYRDLLQQFYDRKKDETTDDQDLENVSGTGGISTNDPQEDQNLINSVNQAVQNTLDTPDGQNNTNAVLSAQAYFYYNNGYYQEAIDAAQKIDIEALDNNWQSNIYEVLANSYYWLGDEENANTYYNLLLSMPWEEE